METSFWLYVCTHMYMYTKNAKWGKYVNANIKSLKCISFVANSLIQSEIAETWDSGNRLCNLQLPSKLSAFSHCLIGW